MANLPQDLELEPLGEGEKARGGIAANDGEDEESDEEVAALLNQGREEEERDDRLDQSLHQGPSRAFGLSGKSGSSWGMGGISTAERALLMREMTIQTLPMLILSLVGAILTGMLLARLQTWAVFIRVEELFILVPILLNLKGNLEMNLAARFSTSANIGELDIRRTRRSLVFGNLALLQVQALLVSLVSGVLAFVLGLLSRNGVHHALQHPIHNPSSPLNNAAGGIDVTDTLRGGYFEVLLVLCVSMLAASLSSAVLGSFMCALVLLCRKLRINPDNIATPIASSLGDLVTLVLLGGLSTLFAQSMGSLWSTVVVAFLLGAIVFNGVITWRNAYVQELLSVGWTPLLLAMVISSASGLILENYVNEFEGFALIAPVMTALAGNAGSIFVSRISTALHSSRKEHYLLVASALFVLTGPILLVFLFFVWVTGQAPVSLTFAIAFVVLNCVQLAGALAMGYGVCILLWRWDYDPDVYALPLLSSVLDVTGQVLLVCAFSFARMLDSKFAVETVAAGAQLGNSTIPLFRP